MKQGALISNLIQVPVGVKTPKSRGRVSTKSIKSEVKRVPKYSALTIIRRSLLTADGEKLAFIPFLEDDDDPSGRNGKRLQKELQDAYKSVDDEAGWEKDLRNIIFTKLDWWLEELPMPCTKRILEQYLVERDTKLGKSFRDGLLRSLGGPLSQPISLMASRFTEAFDMFFHVCLREVLLSRDRLVELSKLVRKPHRQSIDAADSTAHPLDQLETYITLTCSICSAVDCQTHGDFECETAPEFEDGRKLKTDSEDGNWTVPHRLTMQPAELLRKYNERLAEEDNESEFGDGTPKKCFNDCRHSTRTRVRDPTALTSSERDNIHLLLITLRDKQRRSCTIAAALDLSCQKVHAEIERFEQAGGLDLHNDESPVLKARGDRPEWYDNRDKTLRSGWSKLTEAHDHKEMRQANPCAHSGPCTISCPCVKANILCEAICSCPNDCPRRFTGCSCLELTGRCCSTENCICIQLNRECGPLCGSCGAVERIHPDNRHNDALFATGCQNVVLQRGVSKRLIIGESQLAGFGAYTAEFIPKGGFIDEYLGELISHQEADRRGIVYDRRFLSFLFDLNKEWVLDAARFGNKSRFFNHAATAQDGRNIEAKVCLVNSEHRIKMFALRDIKAGEELLFNYGRKFVEKHGLNKKLPKVRESTKKGVVTGKEALDMLDGMNSR